MFARELLPVLGPGAALAVIGSVDATATAAGTSLATATAITCVHTYCTTATEGQGFLLPASMTKGDEASVANATSVTIYVYPPSGGKINGFTASIPISVPANNAIRFVCANGTDWIAIR